MRGAARDMAIRDGLQAEQTGAGKQALAVLRGLRLKHRRIEATSTQNITSRPGISI